MLRTKSRLLAIVSVDDTGLQRRNLRRGQIVRARGTKPRCHIKPPKNISADFVLLTDALDDGPVFHSEQVRPEIFFSSDVPRTIKVQICVASQENASERVCVRVLSPHTNTITEVHDCFLRRGRLLLDHSTQSGYYRSHGGRTTYFERAVEGEIVWVRQETGWLEHFGVR